MERDPIQGLLGQRFEQIAVEGSGLSCGRRVVEFINILGRVLCNMTRYYVLPGPARR